MLHFIPTVEVRILPKRTVFILQIDHKQEKYTKIGKKNSKKVRQNWKRIGDCCTFVNNYVVSFFVVTTAATTTFVYKIPDTELCAEK